MEFFNQILEINGNNVGVGIGSYFNQFYHRNVNWN